jgi:zinc transport system substrate-binding protein
MVLKTVASALAVVLLAGCGSSSKQGAAQEGRQQVVASFFPLAEAARYAGKGLVDVKDLLPAGSQPHDAEVTPKVDDALHDADLVLTMGHKFQPAIESAVEGRGDQAVAILDRIGVAKKDANDPHVWLDPVLMSKLFREVRSSLGDHVNVSAADAYEKQLQDLDIEYAAGLKNCKRRTIVTAHDAFGYLARRYNLTQEPIAGIDPKQQPSADRLTELADLVRKQHITTIFTEEQVASRVAETLAREANVKTAVLDPLESADASGQSYITRMKGNLKALQGALDCTAAR